jgi:hypothetical protein
MMKTAPLVIEVQPFFVNGRHFRPFDVAAYRVAQNGLIES